MNSFLAQPLTFEENGVIALVGVFLDQVDILYSLFPPLFHTKKYNLAIASSLLSFNNDMALLSGERVSRIRPHAVLVTSNDNPETFLSHNLF